VCWRCGPMKRPADEQPGSASSDDEDDDEQGPEEDDAGGDGEKPAGAGETVGGRPLGKRKRSHVVLSNGRMASTKVRNHVNPLLPHFNKPVAVPEGGDWSKVFQDPSKPLVMDLGCAKGRFCLEGARRFPDFNWIGIEIREPLVVRANEWVTEGNLRNLHYIFGNASAGIADLLKALPSGALRRVTVQCPDPCFKKRHQKRRMVTQRLVQELGVGMPVGSALFVQSDVEQVAMQMVDTVMACAPHAFMRVDRLSDGAGAALDPSAPVEPVRRVNATAGRDYKDKDVGGGKWEHKGAGADAEGSYRWLAENPLGLMSERESSTISRGLPMFRALFERVAQPPPTGEAKPAA